LGWIIIFGIQILLKMIVFSKNLVRRNISWTIRWNYQRPDRSISNYRFWKNILVCLVIICYFKYQRKLELLKEMKKAFLQKMFVWRI